MNTFIKITKAERTHLINVQSIAVIKHEKSSDKYRVFFSGGISPKSDYLEISKKEYDKICKLISIE